jgi:hypothetical protein
MVLPLLLTADDWRLATGDYQLLLFFRRNGQPKYRKLTFTSYVGAARALRIGQVQRPANFAAINLRIATPRFFDAAAFLLERIGGVKPALQMATAKLAFLVFFVAGALARLLDFDFMVGKLLQSVRDYGFTSCQRDVLSFERSGVREFGPSQVILLEVVAASKVERLGPLGF